MKIILSNHALASCEKRGISSDEVMLAIEKGTEEPAKLNRTMFGLNPEYNSIWEGRFYKVKQVAPVVIEEDNEIIVITVYAYYF